MKKSILGGLAAVAVGIAAAAPAQATTDFGSGPYGGRLHGRPRRLRLLEHVRPDG
jgi:hypothetical protein